MSITVDGIPYDRIPIQTHTVASDDVLVEVVVRYADHHLRPGDVLFVTEKIVAITQGRAVRPAAIEARPLARLLSRYVHKSPTGIGLGMPETMELAIREVGTLRILAAAAVAAVTKPLGRKGDFYRIAGSGARAIDGPTHGTLPPYDQHIVLGPERPREVAEALKASLLSTVDVIVVDINDLGGNVLGSTMPRRRNKHWVRVLADNPLGQGHQSTPLGIIRRSSPT